MKCKRLISSVVVVAPLLFFSSGCANGPKAVQGAMGGALAGAVVGAQVAGPRGALVGALVGGFVGNSIGSHLDEEDKKRMAELESRALSSGRRQAFTARKSRAAVTITPEAETQEVVRTLTLSPNITAYKLQQKAEVKLQAFVDTPVYASASTREAPRLVLKKGADLVVPAGLQGQSGWGAVVEGNTVIGYVPNSYLQSNSARPYLARASRNPKSGSGPLSAAAQPARAPSANPTPDIQKAPDRVRTAEVLGNCKVLVRRVKLADRNDPITENAKYCKEPPKGWKPVTT